MFRSGGALKHKIYQFRIYAKICALLRYYAAFSANCVRTFRYNGFFDPCRWDR